MRLYRAIVPVRSLHIRSVVLVGVLAFWSTTSQAQESARWNRLSPWAQQTIKLRRAVKNLSREGRVRTAHPQVAQRLSTYLSDKLGRRVQVPAHRIVQVQWGSAEHHELTSLLDQSIGIGIYPSRFGHAKLRVGSKVADTIPKSARPFPRTGTRARLEPLSDGMAKRFFEAVFAASEPSAIQSLQSSAEQLVDGKKDQGMMCGQLPSKLLGPHLEEAGKQAYSAKLQSVLTRVETRKTKKGPKTKVRAEIYQGPLWCKAAGADPALIVVHTPASDFRDITHPDFKFDYIER